MKPQINKFKLAKNDRYYVSYSILRNDPENSDDYTLDTLDKPAPSLLNKIMVFRKWVNEICEFNLKKDDLKSLIIRGFSFSHSKGILGVTVMAQKELRYSNSPLIINTPHKIEDFYSSGGGDKKQLLPSQMVNDAYELVDEIIDFIKGNRAQMNLFS